MLLGNYKVWKVETWCKCMNLVCAFIKGNPRIIVKARVLARAKTPADSEDKQSLKYKNRWGSKPGNSTRHKNRKHRAVRFRYNKANAWPEFGRRNRKNWAKITKLIKGRHRSRELAQLKGNLIITQNYYSAKVTNHIPI